MISYSPPIPRPPWYTYRIKWREQFLDMEGFSEEIFTKSFAEVVAEELAEWFPGMTVSLVEVPVLKQMVVYG